MEKKMACNKTFTTYQEHPITLDYVPVKKRCGSSTNADGSIAFCSDECETKSNHQPDPMEIYLMQDNDPEIW